MDSSHQRLEELFAERGLVFLGVCEPESGKDYERYRQWLAENRHAGLTYLERNTEIRQTPEKLFPGTRSVIVFALPYFHESDGRAARYAFFRDYHRLLRQEGKSIFTTFLKEKAIDHEKFRVAVDSAPILERALAIRAGNGFIGKNTCFIHPERGSFLLLAEIFTTLELSPTPAASHLPDCGTCTLCQVACPTGALDKDYVLDANECLSYWSIEHRGPIPEKFWPHLKETFFGCDICQTVCPYNQSARANELPKWIRPIQLPPLAEIAEMDEEKYLKTFAGTPFTRAKREGLIRNARIAVSRQKIKALDAIGMLIPDEDYDKKDRRRR